MDLDGTHSLEDVLHVLEESVHPLNIVIEKRMGFGLDDGETERIGREYRRQRGIATQRNEITDSRKVDIH